MPARPRSSVAPHEPTSLGMSCTFCAIAAGRLPAARVYETAGAVAFFDRGSVAAYHTLVIPRRHATSIFDIPGEDLRAVMSAVRHLSRLYRSRLGIEAMQIVSSNGQAAQQDAPHFHVHIVPRHEGDGLDVAWTPDPTIPPRFEALLTRLRDADPSATGAPVDGSGGVAADAPPLLHGERLLLRPFRPSDVAERRALGQAREVLRGYGVEADAAAMLTEAAARRWVEEHMAQPLARAIEVEGRLAGAVRLHGRDPHDARASLAIGLLDDALLGRGLGREAIGLVLRHGFGALGLRRVGVRVLASNERAIRCYRACGFHEEGREREAARTHAGWEDDVIMGVLAHEVGDGGS